MRQKQRSVVLCLAFALAFASVAAIAQEEIVIRRGRVMFATNDTIIVQVTEGSELGMHKFTVFDENADQVKFVDREGKEILFSDLRRDDILTEVRVTHASASHATVTETEVEQHVAKAASTTGTAASSTPSSAPTPASMPAQLPKTASPMPLVGLSALALLALAVALRLMRRVRV
jgi:hypothetical protein